MIVKDYDDILYRILRPLVEGENPVKLYRNVIDTDYNSQPHDYVVYSSGLSNMPRLYGDGKPVARRCSCDVTVSELGTGNNDNSGYLVRMVEELLVSAGISYTKVNLGYVEQTDSIQTTFDFYLI